MEVDKRSEEVKLQQLQDILFRKERAELVQLRQLLQEKDQQLAENVQPLIEERLRYFQTNFPLEFERSLHKVIDQRIENSQESILNAIYPVMGKMIRKYIALQFEQLQDRIDQQLNKGLIGRLRNLFSGVKESDEVLNSFQVTGVEEVFVIEKLSGILLGSASAKTTVDRDVVAGMLTAIKSFVEDAFKRENEDLEMIQYGSYSIVLQNFHTYYLALALRGTISSSKRSQLYEMTSELAEQHLNQLIRQMDDQVHLKIKEQLEKRFFTNTTTAQ